MRPCSPSKHFSRGLFRGFFACVLVLCFGCEKSSKESAPVDAGAPATDTAVRAAIQPDANIVDAAPEPAPPPAEFAPPWTAPAAPWDKLKTELADKDIGRLSGEVYGDDRVIRGVVRGGCGAGTMLQFVFEGDKGLQVTPVIPLKFFGLGTGRPVTYEENNFSVFVDFKHDTAERLQGELRITYDQKGKAKTYIDAKVDGEPMSMLLEPRVATKEPFPEFQPCHPNGWFRGTTADGRTAEGLANATVGGGGDAAMVTVLLTPQTGFRFILMRRNGETGPLEIDLDSEKAGADMKVVPEVFYVQELTAPDEAVGMNLGDEEKVNAHQGKVVAELGTGKKPKVVLRFTDLVIPMLLEGPLRGTTFKDLVIEATAFPADEYPVLDGAPSWAEEN